MVTKSHFLLRVPQIRADLTTYYRRHARRCRKAPLDCVVCAKMMEQMQKLPAAALSRILSE